MQPGTCVEVDCDRPATRKSNRCDEHERAYQAQRPRKNWTVGRILLWVGFAVFAVWLVIFVGRYLSDEFGQRDVTLEQYAALVCDLDAPSGDTWGAVRDRLRVHLNARKGLVPLEEMREWHEGKIKMMEMVLDAIDEYDADAPMNEFLLIGNSGMHQAMAIDKAAGRSLSVETHRALRQHGCDI